MSQTVYFTNPAVISTLETEVASLQQSSNGFPFTSVPLNTDDRIVVPENYSATPILKAYDRLATTGTVGLGTFTVPECTNEGKETPESFWYRFGEGCDGMYYVPLNGSSTNGLMVSNHENNFVPCFLYTGGMVVNGLTSITGAECWPNVTRDWQDVYKHMLSLGISVTHIRKDTATNQWGVVLDSSYNKRYNLFSEFRIDGPLRGHPLMKTKHSPDGTMALGTFNNCGSEVTPWGTFLTGEENCWFAFGVTRSQNVAGGRDATQLAAINRYNFIGTGANTSSLRTNWFGYYFGSPSTNSESDRFIGYSGPLGNTNGYSSGFLLDTASTGYLSSPLYGTKWMPTGSFEHMDYTCYGATGSDDFRNIVNQYNQMKEIDPRDPTSVPRVRTGLGRMAHENSATVVEVGKPVVIYMNDDNRNDYYYKYVSDALWSESDRNGGLAAGDKYLNTGTLYVARFNNATLNSVQTYGTGSWLSFKDISYPISVAYGGGLTAVINNYAEALCYARIVGDYLQASRMDRTEWSAVDRRNNIVYTSLTSNRNLGFTATSATSSSWGFSRGSAPLSSLSPRIYRDFSSADALDAAGTAPSSNNNGNQNGGIIRTKCYSGAVANTAATTFRWDHFVFGCTPGTLDNKNINISNLDTSNCLSMPDTVVFGEYSGQRGYMWICTDDAYMTNTCNAGTYVAYIPPEADIGDGSAVTIVSQLKDINGYFTSSGAVTTYVSKSRPISRFLTSTPGGEVTGWSETPNGTSAFVGIQHPGYTYGTCQLNTTLPQVSQGIQLFTMFNGTSINGANAQPESSFPDTSYNRPRSTILVIQRKDGNPII